MLKSHDPDDRSRHGSTPYLHVPFLIGHACQCLTDGMVLHNRLCACSLQSMVAQNCWITCRQSFYHISLSGFSVHRFLVCHFLFDMMLACNGYDIGMRWTGYGHEAAVRGGVQLPAVLDLDRGPGCHRASTQRIAVLGAARDAASGGGGPPSAGRSPYSASPHPCSQRNPPAHPVQQLEHLGAR